MPQVSVIVPARDVDGYIAPLLGDLERQTFTDLEIIVVDDGSTDGTLPAIERFVERDNRFRLLSSGGAGVSAARNVGIDHATGAFLAFVDADDRVDADYLSKLHASISASGSDLVSCNVLRLEGYQTSPSVLHQRAIVKPAAGTHLSRAPHLLWDTTVWNKLWRREMWDRAGIRYAEGRWLNDFYPSIRGHVASRAVDVIPDVLYYWRIRTDPKTSITDSRLTDPVARLKSFDDRMFAIRSARRMIADDLPVKRVLHRFDLRLLRSDLPIYLPFYAESDQRYRDLLVERIGDMLTEFRIRPHQFQLGVQLQRVYGAILSRDQDRLATLLHPGTEIRPSQLRRQRTELVLAGTATAVATTAHGGSGRRLARLARATRLRHRDTSSITADAQVDRITVEPSRPTTLVVQGAVRLREGRSGVAGDWTVAALLDSTRKPAGTRWLNGRPGRAAGKLVPQGPLARIAGAPIPLEPHPDEILHPLARSGWQPFTVHIDLAEAVPHQDEPEWRLSFHLRAGLMDLFPAAKVTKEAARYLPGGFHIGADTDLAPVVSRQGRLAFRRAPIRGQLVRAVGDDDALVLEVSFPGHNSAKGNPVVWLKHPEQTGRSSKVEVTGPRVTLPVPSLDKSARYELWCRTSQGSARMRAHPKLRTVRVSQTDLDQWYEAVLRPTAQGRIVLEARRKQLDLSWLRTDEAPTILLIGGEGNPGDVSQSPLSLVLACPWSRERLEFPIKSHPDGWEAAVDGDLLLKDAESRSWSLLAVKGEGHPVPMHIPAERRALLPMPDTVSGHPVQLRIGDEHVPTLQVGPEPEHNRWRKLRKVRRSQGAQLDQVSAAAAPVTDVAALPDIGRQRAQQSGARGQAAETWGSMDLEAVLGRLTAPQASRSMTKVGSPSFREKVDERIRRRRYLLRHTDVTPITQILIRKPQRDQILSRLGFPVPAKLLECGDLTAVFRVLAEHREAVVKPVSGANGRGVHLLRQSGSGWLSLRTGAELSADELRDKLEQTVTKQKQVTQWQVEQLVVGDSNDFGQPMDYKFYMFQGRLGLTVQMKRLPTRTVYRFYDDSWQAIDVGRDEDKIDNSLMPPPEPQPLLDMATKVSEALPLPFIRVDLLLGHDGPYIGEVTPMPGRYHGFSEPVDRQLGLLWELADLQFRPGFLTAERFQPALAALRYVSGAQRLYPD